MKRSRTSVTKPRQVAFSAEEICTIIEFYEQHYATLNSRLTNVTTMKLKNELYQKLLNSVNATSITTRTLPSIKDKWQNLQRSVKAKVAEFQSKQRKERKKTGGGTASFDTTLDAETILGEEEKRIYHLIPPESISGIIGGVESGLIEPTEETSFRVEETVNDTDIASSDIENVPPPVSANETSFNQSLFKKTSYRRKLKVRHFSSSDYYQRMCQIEADKLKELQRHHHEIELIQRETLEEKKRHNLELERRQVQTRTEIHQVGQEPVFNTYQPNYSNATGNLPTWQQWNNHQDGYQ